MGILDQGRRKTIAIGALLAFTWTGVSWAAGQGARAGQPAVPAEQRINNYADFTAKYKKELEKNRHSAGDYNYSCVLLSGADLVDVLNGVSLRDLNANDIYIQVTGTNGKVYFYPGQGKIISDKDKTVFRFITNNLTATYINFKNRSLWIYDTQVNEFVDFSTKVSASFWVGAKEYDGGLIGFDMMGFARYFTARGWSKNNILDQLGFLHENFGIVCTDDKGAIIEKIFQRSIVYLNDGPSGMFTVSGQLRADPATGAMKGVNYAEIEGKFFAGMGADLVDVQTLLTDAKYNKLALMILNDKSLMVNMIVRVTGSWLLQHGQLNGVAEDIKKFLDYDTSNAPNGYDFNIVNGQVVVMPRQ